MKNTIDNNIMRQVLSLTGWTEQQYKQFKYDCGLAYLNELTPEYPQIIVQISKSKIFWNWWMAHWELRDKEFAEACYDWDEGQDARVQLFLNSHHPATLATAIYLNGQVLQESYVNLIADITKEQPVYA